MAQCGQLVSCPRRPCRFPAGPVGAATPPGGRSGERLLWPPVRGRTTLVPAASRAEALPGVGATIRTSSVPKGGHTEFSSRLLSLRSGATILRTGLVGAWVSACRTVLQTPSSTHNQPFLGWSSLFFASVRPAPPPPPHDPSPEVQGANLSPLWRACTSPGEPTPQNQLQGQDIQRGLLLGPSLKGQEVQGRALPCGL